MNSHTVAGLATPAAETTPLSGLPVCLLQSTASLTALAMLSVLNTLQRKNLVETESSFVISLPSTLFKSSMATFPPALHISSTQAFPRPDALTIISMELKLSQEMLTPRKQEKFDLQSSSRMNIISLMWKSQGQTSSKGITGNM